jgi:hypothetical protein
MKKLLMAVTALACLGSVALAGPNAGGALILHSNPGVVYTVDVSNYCGQGGLTACEAALNSRPLDDASAVQHVIAAFPNGSSPRLASISFGWSYGAFVVLQAYGHCADLEVAQATWPASGSGTALNWNAARLTQLTDVYWVAAYGYQEPGSLCLIPHPTQGATFADDDVPSNLDAIQGLGCFGFGQPGNTPCPVVQAFGACCFPDGSCQVLTPQECQSANGAYQGDSTQCTPGLCPLPVGACCDPATGNCTIETQADCESHGGHYQGNGVPCTEGLCPPPPPGDGACCILGAPCQIMTQTQCDAAGGTYFGDDSTCDPSPCPVPTIERTWGQIKSNYR